MVFHGSHSRTFVPAGLYQGRISKQIPRPPHPCSRATLSRESVSFPQHVKPVPLLSAQAAIPTRPETVAPARIELQACLQRAIANSGTGPPRPDFASAQSGRQAAMKKPEAGRTPAVRGTHGQRRAGTKSAASCCAASSCGLVILLPTASRMSTKLSRF
jgi:hypothetical protein